MAQTLIPSMIRVGTKKRYILDTPDTNTPSQYPSEWFIAHPGQKPLVKYTSYNLTEENVLGVMKKGIKDGHVNVEIVKFFLYVYLDKVKEQLTEDWVSYETVIGSKNEEVSPWCSVQFQETNKPIQGLAAEGADKNDVKWLLIFALSAARLTNIPVQAYFELLRDRIFSLMKIESCPLKTFPPITVFDTWVLDEGYTKMTAAVDMFFNKFPNNPDAMLKICTLRSRFRDCSSLLSVGYVCKLLSLPSETHLLDWLWTDQLAEEIIQMMRTEEEVKKSDSYFPYQTDFRLVSKTYYSASRNPQLYFLIHSVGTLCGSNRSKNAKFLTDSNLLNNIQLAKIMAYAFANNFGLVKAFTVTGDPIKIDTGDSETMLIGEPDSTDGTLWFKYMATRDFQLSNHMIHYINSAVGKIGETRSETIGEYIKNHF